MTFLSYTFSRVVLVAWLAAAVGTGAAAQGSSKSVVATDQVRAELMAHAPDGAEPGKPVWVGLHLTHKPEWHTYWKNSGDSGLPTQLQWTLPPGVEAGDIAWPVPKKIPIGTLANYGYDNTVLLPVPLTVTPQYKPSLLSSEIEVKLKASWLVCRKECIPEEGEFTLRIPIKSSTAINSSAFEAAAAAYPKPLEGASEVEISANAIKVSVRGLPASARGKMLGFFPETPEVIETAAPWTQEWQGDLWTAKVPLSSQRGQSPTVMPLVLALDGKAWLAKAKVIGNWPAVPAAASIPGVLDAALKANAAPAPTESLSFVAAVLGALLGGLILNLMPCVFPVLAIKVIGFSRHAGDKRAHRASGLAYSAGVIASFVALGVAMLALRSAGEQLGWGFQLQSPATVAVLAILFTLIGLNLAGLFEIGRILPQGLATFEARNPTVNAFLSGVLAVAIASPCTAPFMGASLGLAVGLPAIQALVIFGAIGAGMALPYLAASLIPEVARLLPRPGAWMDVFRRVMAFPMFGTVTWLIWVLGQQTGIDGAGALLAVLVSLSMMAWALTLHGNARNVIGLVSAALFAILVAWLGPTITKPSVTAGTVATTDRWQAWEPGRVDQVLATGRPVFVDFTAAWCVTCQYNKKTTLANDGLLAEFETRKVQLLRADWTRRDPAISSALRELGRSGVPVYVIYQSGRAPVVLSEIISVDEVRSALSRI